MFINKVYQIEYVHLCLYCNVWWVGCLCCYFRGRLVLWGFFLLWQLFWVLWSMRREPLACMMKRRRLGNCLSIFPFH